MANQLVVAPVLVVLATIVGALGLRRWPRVQRAASVAGTLAYALAVGTLAWSVALAPDAAGAMAYQLGGWRAPFGISFVADALSTFMLVIAAAVALPAVAFSVVYVDTENQRVFYHVLFHCMLLGITGAFLTGDLFNLFVWFEVMLMASYVLVSFYGGPQHTAAGFRYLVLNVVGSAFLLLAVGGLYAVTGSLNMADVSRRLAEPAAYGVDPAPVVGLTALMFVTFALKAGLVPFQFWVPGAYQAAPFPVAAMLAGATKKVGMYAIVRLYFTVLGGATTPLGGVAGESSLALFAGDSPLSFFGPVLVAVGIASVLVGGLGAVLRDTIEGTLAYSSIGQVGFIAVPIGIAAATHSAALRRLGIVAALVYALHHALAKGLLFLSAGAVRSATGTTRVTDLGGLAGRTPVLAGAFFVGSLSLVGIPPLAGFFGKLLVFDAAARQFAAASNTGAVGASTTAAAAVVVLALLLGAVLTILYMTRIWTRSFWGTRPDRVANANPDPFQIAILAAMAVAVFVIGVGFDPAYRFAEAAAEAAMDRHAYVEAVNPAGGDGA